MRNLAVLAVVLLHPGTGAGCHLGGTPTQHNMSVQSQTEREVRTLVRKLYPRVKNRSYYWADPKTVEHVSKQLRSIAGRSPHARQVVVQALLRVLKDSGPEPVAFQMTWLRAAQLLGKLKATESLDILVRNIDFKGFLGSISVGIKPVVNAVVEIGEAAVPHLERAIRESLVASHRAPRR